MERKTRSVNNGAQQILEWAASQTIDKARAALNLRRCEPGAFGTERVLIDMAPRRGVK